ACCPTRPEPPSLSLFRITSQYLHSIDPYSRVQNAVDRYAPNAQIRTMTRMAGRGSLPCRIMTVISFMVDSLDYPLRLPCPIGKFGHFVGDNQFRNSPGDAVPLRRPLLDVIEQLLPHPLGGGIDQRRIVALVRQGPADDVLDPISAAIGQDQYGAQRLPSFHVGFAQAQVGPARGGALVSRQQVRPGLVPFALHPTLKHLMKRIGEALTRSVLGSR